LYSITPSGEAITVLEWATRSCALRMSKTNASATAAASVNSGIAIQRNDDLPMELNLTMWCRLRQSAMDAPIPDAR
jgi:hypothetical protein